MKQQETFAIYEQSAPEFYSAFLLGRAVAILEGFLLERAMAILDGLMERDAIDMEPALDLLADYRKWMES